MSGQGLMFDQHLYTGQVKFNEGAYFEAAEAFERVLEGATGLDRPLLAGLQALSLGFELLHGRRMLDPALLELQRAADALAQIPLATHMGLDVRQLKDQLAPWIDHLERLGQRSGERPEPPPAICLREGRI